jgi:hypothetical protein
VIWTRNFVAALGQIVGPDAAAGQPVHHGSAQERQKQQQQDSPSTYFFMSDRMAAGEVVVAYLPTERIADILKALVGPSSSRPGPS